MSSHHGSVCPQMILVLPKSSTNFGQASTTFGFFKHLQQFRRDRGPTPTACCSKAHTSRRQPPPRMPLSAPVAGFRRAAVAARPPSARRIHAVGLAAAPVVGAIGACAPWGRGVPVCVCARNCAPCGSPKRGGGGRRKTRLPHLSPPPTSADGPRLEHRWVVCPCGRRCRRCRHGAAYAAVAVARLVQCKSVARPPWPWREGFTRRRCALPQGPPAATGAGAGVAELEPCRRRCLTPHGRNTLAAAREQGADPDLFLVPRRNAAMLRVDEDKGVKRTASMGGACCAATG